MAITHQDLLRIRNYVENTFLANLDTLIANVEANNNVVTANQRKNIVERADRAANVINQFVEIERLEQVKADIDARINEMRQ